MKRDLLWGGLMAAVGVSAFLWASKDSFFQADPIPSPTPNIESTVLPSIAPTPTVSVSEKVNMAEIALQNGNLEYAISLLADETKNEKILNILIQASIQQGEYNQSEEYIKELLAIENTQENISGYIRILLLKGEKETAQTLIPKLEAGKEKTFYQLILAVVDNEHDNAQTYAEELLQYSEYEKVANGFLDVYKTYASFQDGSPHYLSTMLANVLKTLQFHELTVQYIKPTLSVYPEYRDAWIVIGNSYLALKKYDIAERMLEKAVSLDPTHPISPYLLGVTLYELGQKEDAIVQIKNAIKNGYKPREKAERVIADIYFSHEAFEDALEHYQYIIAEGNPTLSDYSKSVFITLTKIDTPQLANSFAQKAEADMPTNPKALSLQAWILIETDKLEDAQTLLNTLSGKYPENIDIMLRQAELFEKQKKYQESLEMYSQCYEQGNSVADAVSIECAQKYESLRIQLQE